MLVRSNFVERRKHHRFKVKDHAVALFHKPRFFKFGKSRVANSAQIVDLSLGGLSFQYTASNMWTPDFNELSITNNSDEIKVANISFTPVSDFSISRVADNLLLRRCGVRFGELTPSQKNQLHAFIQNHTLTHFPRDRRSGKDRRSSEHQSHDDADRRKGLDRRKKLLKN